MIRVEFDSTIIEQLFFQICMFIYENSYSYPVLVARMSARAFDPRGEYATIGTFSFFASATRGCC